MATGREAQSRELIEDLVSGRLSRRAFIARAAALGLSGSAIAGFLAACGAASTATAAQPTVRAAATTAATNVPSGAGATVAAGATQASTAVSGAATQVAPTVAAAATQVAGGRPAGSPAASPGRAAGPVKLTSGKLVLAVLNDQSGIYADLSGKNTTKAVKMAVDDFLAKNGKDVFGGTVEVIDADHQNKPDLASTQSQQFYDRDKASVILDVPTSSAGLAVAEVAKQKRKLYINLGSATSDLTNASCNRYTFHYSYDTWMLANGTGTYVTKNLYKKWYIIYPNYAYGQDMDKSFQEAIKKSGGTIVQSDPTPFPSTDFSSFLLKAPSLKPDVLGVMQAGGELQTVVKQYNEFKLKDQKIALAIGLLFDSDIKALGPDALAGTIYTTAWNWTIDADARAWADKFKQVAGVRPTFLHAGNYSAAWQYMEAILRAGTDDADAVAAQLEGYKFNDFFARNATIRKEDHLLLHDVYQAEVKAQKDVTEDGDYSKILSTIPADQAFRPLDLVSCKMQ